MTSSKEKGDQYSSLDNGTTAVSVKPGESNWQKQLRTSTANATQIETELTEPIFNFLLLP
jgi:hypothetical protein